MATITYPSPELFAAVFETIRAADLYQDTVSDTFSNLAQHLTDDEAEQLPDIIKGLLPLLRGDLSRLRFVGEILVGFDMFEAADELACIAIELRDDEMLHSAAALCGNPGINPAVREKVAGTSDSHNAQIMLNHTVQPTTEDEKQLYEQRWPGSRDPEGDLWLSPVAVLDTSLPASKIVRLAVHLMSAGVVVRRLRNGDPIPNWFGPQTIVLCRPAARSRILSYQPRFPERQIIVDPKLDNYRDYDALMRKCNAAITGHGRFRLSDVDAMPALVWDPEVYNMGVYPTHEAAFLTSAPKSSFSSLAKKELLIPRQFRGRACWSFGDLVAVRTWRYMKAESDRQIKPDIIPALARFAGDSKAVTIGVTSSGRVLVDQGDGWVDPLTGEQPLDMPITDLDDVFKPFRLGHHQAPNMLDTSENTRAYPAILGGTPHCKGSRIPAQALAEIHHRGGDNGVTAAYPQLEGRQIKDAIGVGYRLIAVKTGH